MVFTVWGRRHKVLQDQAALIEGEPFPSQDPSLLLLNQKTNKWHHGMSSAASGVLCLVYDPPEEAEALCRAAP